MKPNVTVFALALSVLLLSGCAGFVRSDVAVFHQLGETPAPKTYLLVPLRGQESSLEYKTYAELVRKELGKYQYREVSGDEIPNVVIAFSYGIDSGREKLDSIPVFGQTGVSSSTTYGTLSTYGNYGTYSGTTTYTPNYGIVGSSTVSRTEYGRGLWLYIIDASSVGTETLNVLYEGSVRSSGSSSQLSRVMPAMIEALFKSFPGKSGETRRVLVPMQ
ncbi:DUF4136 domain-containing protein [Halomonas sp. LBP4]|uniref:DUF4136 domain-containing protein n=1 Tax=Halomonas sp. LBP4 TaxID=2044917 RepID=UPI000D75C9EF|nr:DUF4136 domain-containing protein [Halomonas sp. LBP4]PXX95909.1 hypothetical protein CR157_17070 [Halomonas sp. LBP4]